MPDVQANRPGDWCEMPKGAISRLVILLGVLNYWEVRAIEYAIVLAMEDGTLGREHCDRGYHLRLVATERESPQ